MARLNFGCRLVAQQSGNFDVCNAIRVQDAAWIRLKQITRPNIHDAGPVLVDLLGHGLVDQHAERFERVRCLSLGQMENFARR